MRASPAPGRLSALSARHTAASRDAMPRRPHGRGRSRCSSSCGLRGTRATRLASRPSKRCTCQDLRGIPGRSRLRTCKAAPGGRSVRFESAVTWRTTVLGLPSVAEISVHGLELVHALVPESGELTFSGSGSNTGEDECTGLQGSDHQSLKTFR